MAAEPAKTGPVLKVQVEARATPARRFALDVSFTAPPGVTVLFGPSGAGKSLTLAAIAGLLRPDRGRIVLGDDVLFDSELRRERPVHEREISLVFQELHLFPHLTALENVTYGMARHEPRAERRRRAMQMLERMRVAHLAGRRPATYSGGEAQRVALARAFARRPRLLLLDEPFSALDRELHDELVREVGALVAELAVPAVLVTHSRSEAIALGQKLVALAGGGVVAAGPVEPTLAQLARADAGTDFGPLGERASPGPAHPAD